MQEVDRIITGGRILVLNEKKSHIRAGIVAIDGENIVAVGEKTKLENRYIGREIIDASGCLIMPGLINCHNHAAMTCFRGIADGLELTNWLNFPAESENVKEELIYWGSMLACAEMIKSGTTTFCDMYIFEDETAKAAKKAGMRCLLGEALFDFPSPNFQTSGGVDYTRMLIEKWAGDPLVNIVVEPHSLYTCSIDLLKDAKAIADRYNIPYATHLLKDRGEREQLFRKFGGSPVAFLKDIGYLTERFIAFHCVSMDEEEMKLFAEHGCKVVHNPGTNMKLASGIAPVPDMLNAGVTVGLGTDGCASNNNLDMFAEMDMAAKLHKVHRLDPTVMDAGTVVRMATCEGAKALGMEDTFGNLEPGMKADIAIINLNKPHLTPIYNEFSHLVYTVNGGDVDTVLINGKVVMRGRQLLTIDENEVMERVNEIAVRIRKSLG
jgi:5-methylthioadenosine/S-adenosylhomocysteine deaminase